MHIDQATTFLFIGRLNQILLQKYFQVIFKISVLTIVVINIKINEEEVFTQSYMQICSIFPLMQESDIFEQRLKMVFKKSKIVK